MVAWNWVKSFFNFRKTVSHYKSIITQLNMASQFLVSLLT